MFFTLTIPALLLTLIAAQNTTTSLLLGVFSLDDDPTTFAATVIGSSLTATTYLLDCDSGNISDDCGLYEPLTLVEGPSTASWSTVFLFPGVTDHFSCTLTGTTTGQCAVSQTRGVDFTSEQSLTYDSSDTADEIETFTLDSANFTYVPVVITARGKAIASGSVTATVSSTSGSAKPAGALSGSAATATTAKGRRTTAIAPGTTGTGSPTAGMPRVTQNVELVFGIAFAAAGLAYGGM